MMGVRVSKRLEDTVGLERASERSIVLDTVLEKPVTHWINLLHPPPSFQHQRCLLDRVVVL